MPKRETPMSTPAERTQRQTAEAHEAERQATLSSGERTK